MRVDVIYTSVEAVLGAIARGEERVRWGVRCVAKALLLHALVMLVGCASSPSATPASPNAGRYQISQDRAPTRVLNASEVRDVVPIAINRTMAGNRSPYEVLGKRYRVMSSEEGYFERGVSTSARLSRCCCGHTKPINVAVAEGATADRAVGNRT